MSVPTNSCHRDRFLWHAALRGSVLSTQCDPSSLTRPPRAPSSPHKKQKHIINESLVLSLAVSDLMQVRERSSSLARLCLSSGLGTNRR